MQIFPLTFWTTRKDLVTLEPGRMPGCGKCVMSSCIELVCSLDWKPSSVFCPSPPSNPGCTRKWSMFGHSPPAQSQCNRTRTPWYSSSRSLRTWIEKIAFHLKTVEWHGWKKKLWRRLK